MGSKVEVPTRSTDRRNERRLMVLTFESPLKANEALLEALHLQGGGHAVVHDAVFVHRDGEGNLALRETADVAPVNSALSGSFWGVVFGTIVADPPPESKRDMTSDAVAELEIGIGSRDLMQIRSLLSRGQTALALVVSDLHDHEVFEDLRRFPVKKMICITMAPEAFSNVKEALEHNELHLAQRPSSPT